MKIYTIGFAGKTEEEFYRILRDNKVRQIWDIRRWRNSTAAHFAWARGDSLAAKCKHKYRIVSELAPTDELLKEAKNKTVSLDIAFYKIRNLFSQNSAATAFKPNELNGVCLMCSEKLPENCHRKIAAEYLARCFADIRITHL